MFQPHLTSPTPRAPIQPFDLEAALRSHPALRPPATELVRNAFTDDAIRASVRLRHSVVVRFSSVKMDLLIESRNRSIAYPFVLQMELDSTVLGYICHPLALTVPAERPAPSFSHIPDFLVLFAERPPLLVDILTNRTLDASQRHKHPRYARTESGIWVAPRIAAAAEEQGFAHAIVTADQIHHVWCRNARVLLDFHFPSHCAPSQDEASRLLAPLRKASSLTVEAALALPGMRADVVYSLIASQEVFFDWNSAPLSDPASVWIHSDRSAFESFQIIDKQLSSHSHPALPQISLDLKPDDTIQWLGESYRVLHSSARMVLIHSCTHGESPPVHLPVCYLEEKLSSGELVVESTNGANPDAAEELRRLLRAQTPERRTRALYRQAALIYADQHGGKPPNGVSRRSLRRWAKLGQGGRAAWHPPFPRPVPFFGIAPRFPTLGPQLPSAP